MKLKSIFLNSFLVLGALSYLSACDDSNSKFFNTVKHFNDIENDDALGNKLTVTKVDSTDSEELPFVTYQATDSKNNVIKTLLPYELKDSEIIVRDGINPLNNDGEETDLTNDPLVITNGAVELTYPSQAISEDKRVKTVILTSQTIGAIYQFFEEEVPDPDNNYEPRLRKVVEQLPFSPIEGGIETYLYPKDDNKATIVVMTQTVE